MSSGLSLSPPPGRSILPPQGPPRSPPAGQRREILLTDYRTAHPLRSDEDAGEKLVLVSNRGPVCHRFSQPGRLERVETGGGVATALSRVAAASPVTWLASAASPADRMLALADRSVEIGRCAELRFVDVPEP